MSTYSVSRLSNHALSRDLAALAIQDRATMALFLAHLAEFDERKLYAPAGYPSMYAYCLGELRLSEDAAFRRIQAARTARRFPAIFAAIADGQLSLSRVLQLAPYLTQGTFEELLKAAAHKSKAEVEKVLAERFPQPDLPTLVQAVASSGSAAVPHSSAVPIGPLDPAPAPVDIPAPARVETVFLRRAEPPPRPRVTPLAPERYALQVTISQSTHDKLRHAQELLSHALPSGDVSEVLDQALDALITQLEKRKFAATSKPLASRSSSSKRHVPAAVKRAVWKRDGGQCTFVTEKGKRCRSRSFLEFDHIDEVARGGRATVENMRLRCRSHNQYGAECRFGAGFMGEKWEHARCAAEVSAAPAISASPPGSPA